MIVVLLFINPYLFQLILNLCVQILDMSILQAKAGFRLTFRMPNETVLSQEFGILLSPGKEYHINLHTKQVKNFKGFIRKCTIIQYYGLSTENNFKLKLALSED